GGVGEGVGDRALPAARDLAGHVALEQDVEIARTAGVELLVVLVDHPVGGPQPGGAGAPQAEEDRDPQPSVDTHTVSFPCPAKPRTDKKRNASTKKVRKIEEGGPRALPQIGGERRAGCGKSGPYPPGLACAALRSAPTVG